MRAAYTLVEEAALDRLVEEQSGALVAALEELEAAPRSTFYLDKMWDGLHFLLTGVSAETPIDEDPLSEAVVGVHVFDADDYVGCTELDELPRIVAALEAVRLDELLRVADFSTFANAKLYPNIWSDDPAVLRGELAAAFAGLVDVHRRAVSEGRHLVVSIL